jgi:hypothetical protein
MAPHLANPDQRPSPGVGAPGWLRVARASARELVGPVLSESGTLVACGAAKGG